MDLMQQKLEKLEIRSLGDCTIREMTEQWNTGFQQYLGSSMSMSIVQMSSRIGRLNIHPELSVAAFIEGVPAGFVMIGIADVGGRKMAWNGGTGVNPEFRGLSLSKRLLQEAIRRTKEAGAHSLSLETRVENDRAIRSYSGCGFQSKDKLHVMRKEGAFTSIPFLRERGVDYRAIPAAPYRVGKLSYYPLLKNSWTTEWFATESSEAIIALDVMGQPAGYAIYKKGFSGDGKLERVQLTQCEADPQRVDGRNVVRFLLDEVFAPQAGPISRNVHYLRESNVEVLDALREAEFQHIYTEHLMVLDFM